MNKNNSKIKVTKFQEKVYLECSKIPKGKVTTYNAIAKKLTSSPRAVGQALKHNPYAPKIPCHRVINSNRTLGGYNGKADNKKKLLMLKKEGIIIKNNKVDKKCII
ncbi:MAG: MGMT family protein [Candidatus Woesearchaeota archaeon]